MDAAASAAEAAARRSYGRLVAFLVARTRDIAAAEDALGEAFRAALDTWPRDGVPRNPEAWLMTVARRAHGSRERAAARAAEAEPEIGRALDEEAARAAEEAAMTIPDDRLKLLFICAHPAIDRTVHTPLMLQVVLGLDAARIAAAFLVPAATMGQRLVRAKAKIKAARVRFAAPERVDLPERLEAVLEAVFGAYGAGWDEVGSAEGRRRDLSGEAVFLGRLLAELMPAEPEVKGLLAAMLYAEARASARRDPAGAYVPLAEQDTALWNAGLIAEADALVAEAGAADRFGRFQCMAAIQAVHAARASTGRTDSAALDLLYEALAQFSPTAGVLVARAAARAEARGAPAGLALLDELPGDRVASFQPYWAVRASLLARLGLAQPARAAFDRAGELATDPAVRAHLAAERRRLGGP